MDLIVTAIIVAITAIIIIVAITASITFIFKRVLPTYKRETTEISFSELLVALNTIIENEIDLYDKSVFEGNGRIGSSAQFENYYKDLVERILVSLSDDFFDRMEVYMKKEAVAAFICRLVKAYLGKKVV